MKLHKTPDCLEKLNNLFDRTSQDFAFADMLCDVLYELEKQANKFIKLQRGILIEHYDDQKDGTWKPKKEQDLSILQKKTDELNALEFKITKTQANKPECVSPRELYYLKEFFNFE